MGPPARPAVAQSRSNAERQFIDALVQLAPSEGGGEAKDRREAANRATLAKLRRGLGKSPGEALQMFEFVGKFLPERASEAEQDAYFLVAALFAMHPKHQYVANARYHDTLGTSFARLKREEEKNGPERGTPIERRFSTVLRASRDKLPEHLRHAISLLRTKEVGVDYMQLLHDIRYWDTEDRSVQRSWANAFWGRSAQGQAAEEATIELPTDDDQSDDE